MKHWERAVAAQDPYRVAGLSRGLAVLRGFTPQRAEQSLSEIAGRLGVTRSAAFRAVHTLAAEGYLLKVPGTARFRLGPQVLGLSYGLLASRELLEVAQSPLEALRDRLDWSTHLGVLDGRHVLYLIRFPASDGMSSLVHVGSRLPAAKTAMGRLLLAQRPAREVRQRLADRPAAEVAETLRRMAEDAASDSVAHDGQFESGLCSVAAPVRDMSGSVVAAISATKSGGTITDGVAQATRHAAHAITRRLGAP